MQLASWGGGGGGGEGEEEEDGELPYRTIVFDCALIGFADSMGITVLEQDTCMINMRHKNKGSLMLYLGLIYIFLLVSGSNLRQRKMENQCISFSETNTFSI